MEELAIMSDMRTREEQRQSYVAKTAYLCEQFNFGVSADVFYRDLFPVGSLQKRYKQGGERGDGGFNAIVNVVHNSKRVPGKTYRKNHLVTDDLDLLTQSYRHNVAFVAPCSFLGQQKTLKNLRYIYAFVVDLDYVDVDHIKNLLHQCQIGYVPRPTYIVNSGTGLHLYYMLEQPLYGHPSNQPAYEALKHALIGLAWNAETSAGDTKQYSGLVQPYRVIGTRSKLDCDNEGHVVGSDYDVLAFKTGSKWTLDALVSFEPSIDILLGDWNNYIQQARELLGIAPSVDPNRITLDKARELWPGWYEERIVEGKPCRPITEYKWHIKRDLYDWWLRRIRAEARPGHRYYCVMMLAVYAIKCDISEEELRRDAQTLLEPFEGLTDDETNHFTQSDIEQALHAFRTKQYATLPINSIEYYSGLRIEKSKRSGRSQEVHLATARAVQNVLDPEGEWRNKDGAPTKEQLIKDYAAEHPGASQRAIAKALGVSPTTVNKWLKNKE